MSEYYQQHTRKDRLMATCKTCSNIASHRRYQDDRKAWNEYAMNWKKTHHDAWLKIQRRYRLTHRDELKAYSATKPWLMSTYGITKAEYDKMRLEQQDRCLVCGERKETLVVDHDHKRNKIRGLICHRCNLGIGLFHDDPILLEKVIRYLRDQLVIELSAR